MSKHILKYIFLSAFLVSFQIVPVAEAQTSNVACLNLQSDLSVGITDTTSDHSVKALQVYLVQTGYLHATPNGIFGPATLAAVKSFQSSNGISPTGMVGTMTRGVIQSKACYSNVNVPISSSAAASLTATTIPKITSPHSGDALTIGNNYQISWASPVSYQYDIVLEDINGAGAGYITGGLSGGTNYNWKAGNVLSPSGSTEQSMATGTYRVRIRRSGSINSTSDSLSGWFTLTAPPLLVSTVMPSSVPADSRTTAVIYGTGFTNSSTINFDSQYGQPSNRLYASPDGTVLLFTVPKSISPGWHTLVVGSPYGSVETHITITGSSN